MGVYNGELIGEPLLVAIQIGCNYSKLNAKYCYEIL